MPAERVRIYRKTSFRRVPINEQLYSPFGWVCGDDRSLQQRGDRDRPVRQAKGKGKSKALNLAGQ